MVLLHKDAGSVLFCFQKSYSIPTWVQCLELETSSLMKIKPWIYSTWYCNYHLGTDQILICAIADYLRLDKKYTLSYPCFVIEFCLRLLKHHGFLPLCAASGLLEISSWKALKKTWKSCNIRLSPGDYFLV